MSFKLVKENQLIIIAMLCLTVPMGAVDLVTIDPLEPTFVEWLEDNLIVAEDITCDWHSDSLIRYTGPKSALRRLIMEFWKDETLFELIENVRQ